MTVTAGVPHREPWTIDDVDDLPDDGNRYEIADGSLIVSPPPDLPHGYANHRLGKLLERYASAGLLVLSQPIGIDIRRRGSYYIPDLVVVPEAVMRTTAKNLSPADVLLVAEVLSPSNRLTDLLLKRHDYAAAGIPHYWIVDRVNRTLTVLVLDEGETTYREEAVVEPGKTWTTDRPFAITVDPAELF
jgi:Uma2 family endonuclease